MKGISCRMSDLLLLSAPQRSSLALRLAGHACHRILYALQIVQRALCNIQILESTILVANGEFSLPELLPQESVLFGCCPDYHPIKGAEEDLMEASESNMSR